MRAISSVIAEQDSIQQEATRQDSASQRNKSKERRKERAQRSERRTITSEENSATTIPELDSALLDTIRHDVEELIIAESDSARKSGSSAIDKPISGRAMDSLYYDLRTKKVYLYNQGDVTYGNFNLKADYMDIDLNSKNIYAYGSSDTLDGEVKINRPTFTEGNSTLNMDTIVYNITTQKAKIEGIATQQGDGWLIGERVKKMPDNTINIAGGMYTTCDHTDHPHFYYDASQIKVIPGKKAIMGPGHLVIEDVHIPIPSFLHSIQDFHYAVSHVL